MQDALANQQSGANACAMGRSVFDNPWYRSENMPRATGETVSDWLAKAEAWELGWEMERAMRPDPLARLLVGLTG